MKKFLINITLFTSVLIVLVIGLSYIENPLLIHPLAWSILLLYYLLSIAAHSVSLFGKRSGDDSFVQFFLLATGIRLFGSLIFIAIFLYKGIDHRTLFVVDFFVVYLLYTGFDISALIPNLRTQSKKQ